MLAPCLSGPCPLTITEASVLIFLRGTLKAHYGLLLADMSSVNDRRARLQLGDCKHVTRLCKVAKHMSKEDAVTNSSDCISLHSYLDNYYMREWME